MAFLYLYIKLRVESVVIPTKYPGKHSAYDPRGFAEASRAWFFAAAKIWTPSERKSRPQEA